MDEAFLTDARIPKAAVTALLARSDRPAVKRFIIQYGLFLSAATVVALAPSVGWPGWASALGVAVCALSVMSQFALMHESAHGTAFASRAWNRLVCWCATAPFFYTPTSFREFHFDHHRHTHDPLRDPEISIAGKPVPGVAGSAFIYLGFMSGVPLLLLKVAMLCAAALGIGPVWSRFLTFVPERARRRLAWEARAVLALNVLWLVAAVLWLPGLVHLYVAQLLGHMLLSWYIAAEHNGLPHAGDVLARTRTIHAGAALRWLMWNMPYHAEHHAYPAVPWHALPRLHELMQPTLRHVDARHRHVHRRVLASLARGRPYTEPTA